MASTSTRSAGTRHAREEYPGLCRRDGEASLRVDSTGVEASPKTVQILEDAGIIYSHLFMHNDCQPYYLR